MGKIMLFQSLHFVIFLTALFLIYWCLPHRYRWGLLLLAGYWFYACLDYRYVFILFGITLVTYCVVRVLDYEKFHKRRLILVLFIAFEIGVLVALKYLNFFTESINFILGKLGRRELPIYELLIPVGISFYLFRTMAYAIDVYRYKLRAEKHLGYFALCIAFFPILLSGPIERMQDLLPQFKEKKQFVYENAGMALQQMLLGYYKKLIIADSIAVYVDQIYLAPLNHKGFSVLLAVLLYSVEIYCDFSGYSDIAIGAAGLLGISLKPNFERPYFATSIKEFWRRWHISLTSWFRDYVYIPLGGNRVADWKKDRNVLVTFLLSGLWHGSGWTFVFWGAMHGFMQIVETHFKKKLFRKRFHVAGILKRLGVFVLVSIAWVFFRANNMAEAWNVLSHSVSGISSIISYLDIGELQSVYSLTQILFLIVFGLLLYLYELREEKGQTKLMSIGATTALFVLCLFYYMRYGTDQSAFIYFQF